MFNQNLILPVLTLRKKQSLAALTLLLFSLTSLADNPDISVESASLSLQNEIHLLNARINYSLSKDAIEAINNGVTLTFKVDFSVAEPRPWLWDKTLHSLTIAHQIRYHTLAETYQVTQLTSNLQLNFSSLEAALTSLGTLSEIPIHALTEQPGVNPVYSINAYLPIISLPLPMRPLAYITPGWYLRSDLYQWSLNP